MTGLKSLLHNMKGKQSLYSALLLLMVIIGIHLSTISAELTRLDKGLTGDSNSLPPNNNMVTTYDECKKYLCKYGYLKCICQQHLLRKRRQLVNGLFPTEYDVESDSTTSNIKTADETNFLLASKDTNMPICTEKDFIAALESFQKNYRLDITGLCDEQTTSQMSVRRCGQPDTIIDKLDDEIIEEESISRRTRSLSSIINEKVMMEEALETRKRQLRKYIEDIKSEKTVPQSIVTEEREEEREKRSLLHISVDDGAKINKDRVSWRLMINHRHPYISEDDQRGIMRLAFRYWSEVAPLCFYEVKDNGNTRVDVEIGFLEGVHLGCYKQFDGYGGEIAHKFHRDVHFDSSEPYTVELQSGSRISLLLVALHELGHVIGLNHSIKNDSVMNAIYHQSVTGIVKLSDHDRKEILRVYGACYGGFDTVFDFVRYEAGTTRRIFNSYFFRNDHFWRYENQYSKPRTGDPLTIDSGWGLPKNIDTFLHYYHYSGTHFYDEHIFFKGANYYKYNAQAWRIEETGLISSKFPFYNHSVPTDLDAAFYDGRHDVSLTYFFKDNLTYVYNYHHIRSHGCCADVKQIVEVFPPASPANYHLHPNNSYATGIDSVYFSNSLRKLYFIKGDDVWENKHFTPSRKTNQMKYVGKWFDKWHHICETECSA